MVRKKKVVELELYLPSSLGFPNQHLRHQLIPHQKFLMLEQEFMMKIERTIANLTENQREVFLLNRIEKKKYEEIAVLLNVSIKTVEKRMHLALKTMKEQIGNV